jgi:glycosyltransferase involved in cell wall biosynthesis
MRRMSGKVSIITPIFNGIRFIEFCIKNVIEQNCRDAEHIIVDGGSTDGTVEVIERYAAKYPHIRWISEKDQGQSDAMNKGLTMAQGEMIGFLNVDDFYEPGTLNWVVERFAVLSEPTLLVGNCNVWGDDGTIRWVNRPAHLKLTQLLVADESRYPFPVNPSAYFYHKSLHDIIGMYDTGEHYTLDIDFILKAVRHAHCLYIDKTLGNYRYISGTKTYDDLHSGTGDVRFVKLIERYRKQLPWQDRLYVSCLSLWSKLSRQAGV